MSYSQDNGYTPVDFETLIDQIRVGINDQFLTSYTPETFIGTSWYKYAYAIVQQIQRNEIKTSEIFQKLQEYIRLMNEGINRPSVTYLGLMDSFKRDGYVISIKPPNDIDAGKIFICVDVEDTDPDYADIKHDICTKIKDYVSGGFVSQGTEVESITLSNGQAFDFKFELPTRIPILVRATITVSSNNAYLVPQDVEIRTKIFDNIKKLYQLGYDFEPQRYYSQADAPWASSILVEYSLDAGSSWDSSVLDGDYNELYTLTLDDIEVF